MRVSRWLGVALSAGVLAMAGCGSDDEGSGASEDAGGVIVEQGPPADVIGNPTQERTRTFLKRVLDPTHVEPT